MNSRSSNTISNQEILTALARATELAREESLALLDDAGDELPRLVASNQLLLGVDRSYARDLLTRIDAQKVYSATRVDIRSAVRVTKVAAVLVLPLLLCFIALSFWAFGWWGIAAIPGAFLMFQFCVNSNMRGGWLSIWLALAFGAVAVQAPAAPLRYWALAGALFAVAHRLIYTIPTPAVRRAALESPHFAEVAIDANAVILKKPDA